MNKEIKKAIEEDNLVLFVGAGMSIPLGFPDWKKLIKEILKKLKVDFEKKYQLHLIIILIISIILIYLKF
jgi:NAD-dependent SIR2 family protein deacetylase